MLLLNVFELIMMMNMKILILIFIVLIITSYKKFIYFENLEQNEIIK